MAAKEYELLFQLTARLDSAFQSSFSSAQGALSGLQNGANTTSTAFENFRTTTMNLAYQFSSLSMVANEVADVMTVVTDAIESSVSVAAEFEYTMSAVEAVSGATSSEMEELSALAKELGASTVYTAREVAEAMETEALAGWSVNDMLEGMTGLVNLAAAAGEDLTSVTSIVSDALNAFGLSGEESVVHFVDTLAAAATSANTTITLLGDSLSYVETTAANLDYSIEDVSIALAAMADMSMKGSASGQALNTMLTRMSGANSNAAGEMEALGLSMYNTDGTAKDLLTFMNELRDAFADFGDDAQAAQIAAYKLAGQRGMRGLLAIVNTSEEAWAELADEIYNCEGAAEDISTTRLDNYTGQVTLLESAWEGLQTTIGESLLPISTWGAGVLTDLVTGVNDLASACPTLTQVVTTLGAGFAYTVKYGAQAVSAVSDFIMPVAWLMKNVDGSFITNLQSFGSTLGGAFYSLSQSALFKGTLYAAAGVALVASVAAIVNTFNEAKEAATIFDDYATELEEIAADAEARNAEFDELMAGDREITVSYNVVTALDEAGLEAAENSAVLSQTASTFTTGRSSSASATETDPERAAAINSQVDSLTEDIISYKSLIGGIEADLWELLESSGIDYEGDLRDYVPQNDFGSMSSTTWFDVTEGLAALDDAYDLLDEAEARLLELSPQISDTTYDLLTGLMSLDEDTYTAMDEAITAWAESYNTVYAAAYESIYGQFGLWDQVGEHLATMGQAYQEAFDSALESYQGLYSLWDEVEARDADETVTFSTLTESAASQENFWAEYAANLQSLMDSDIYASLSDEVWGQLTDGSQDAADSAAALVDVLNSGDTDGLEAYIETLNTIEALEEETAAAAAERSAETLDDLKEYRQSQIDALAEYQANLEALAATGLDFSSLYESMYSGDESAMSLVAAMANDLAENGVASLQEYIDLQDEYAAAAQDAATAATGLSDEAQAAYEDLVNSLTTALEELDIEAMMEVAEAIGIDIVNSYASGLEEGVDGLEGSLADVLTGAIEGLGGTGTVDLGTSGLFSMNALEITPSLVFSIDETQVAEVQEQAQTIGEGVGQGYLQGVEASRAEVISTFADAMTESMDAAATAAGTHSPSTITDEIGQNVDLGFIQGVEALASQVESALSDTATAGLNAFAQVMGYARFYQYGRNAMQGAVAGIRSMQSALVAAARAAGTAAANAYAQAQQINSPSKLFAWFSEMDMTGAIQGIEENQDRVNAAMAAAGQANAAAYLSGGTASSTETTASIDPALLQVLTGVSGQTAATPDYAISAVNSDSGSGDTVIYLTYSPTVNAGTSATSASIKEMLDEDKENLNDYLNTWADKRDRAQKRGVY